MRTSLIRDRLARLVAGAVYDGAESAAAVETAGFNQAVTHRPAVVVAASSAADVKAAVRFANIEGLPVAVQATGHGAAQASDCTVFVSTKHMQGVTVDPIARVARVDAGVRWRKVIDAAVPHGLAPLSGSSSSVGVVGYTLGGGMGHLARRHGFAADHVRSIDMVTAAGEFRTVTAASDPELFWGLRGGQGRFGIVTALEFDLIPTARFFGGAMIFTGGAIERVLRAFAEWAPTMPEEVTTSVALLRLPDSEQVPPPLRRVVSLALRFGFTGSLERGVALLQPMRQVAAPVLDSIGPMSYAAVDRIHMDPTEPLPAITTGGLLHSMPEGLVDTLLAMAGPDVEIPLTVVEIRLMGGALSRPAPVPNAVAGREGAYSLVAVAPAPPPMADLAQLVTAQLLAAAEPWSTGTSLVNFAGHGGASELSRSWTPATLQRLIQLKETVDPRNVFGGRLAAPALLPAGAR